MIFVLICILPKCSHYTNDPVDPGPILIYTPWDDAAAHCNIRAQWEYTHKRYNDVKTRNMALVDRKLSLIAELYKANFNLKLYSNPNMNFKDASTKQVFNET